MWTRNNGGAGFAFDDLAASVADLATPHGIEWQWQANPLGTLFVPMGIVGPEKLAESYVRDDDLVITFEERSSDHIRTQYYWRIWRPTPRTLGGVEVWISVETSRLDSLPRLTLESRFPTATSLSLASHGEWIAESDQPTNCHLIRPAESAVSILLATSPEDPSMSVRADSDTMVAESTLFGEPLEKGVLRRSRAVAWCLDRDQDQAFAGDLLESFCQAPPPLTA